MTVRFANIKTIPGFAAAAAMVGVGAQDLIGTAQATTPPTPPKPNAITVPKFPTIQSTYTVIPSRPKAVPTIPSTFKIPFPFVIG